MLTDVPPLFRLAFMVAVAFALKQASSAQADTPAAWLWVGLLFLPFGALAARTVAGPARWSPAAAWRSSRGYLFVGLGFVCLLGVLLLTR